MPANSAQREMIIAYFQGGNTKDIHSWTTIRDILRTIKEVEQESETKFNETEGD